MQKVADADGIPATAAMASPTAGNSTIQTVQPKDPEPGRAGVLTQAVVDRWCFDAKEKHSVAAFDRLMKVTAVLGSLVTVRQSGPAEWEAYLNLI